MSTYDTTTYGERIAEIYDQLHIEVAVERLATRELRRTKSEAHICIREDINLTKSECTMAKIDQPHPKNRHLF